MAPTTTDLRTGRNELCYRIVSAIADARGVDVTDVEDRLYDVVDGDALARLIDRSERAGGDLRVTFTVADVEVVVTAGRQVRVTAPVE